MRRRRTQVGRRGVIYVLAMAVSLVVAAIGLSTLISLRTQQRTARLTTDRIRSELAARTGVDWARLTIEQDPNWRTTKSNGTWLSTTYSDGTSVTVTVVDPIDGNLSNDPMQSIEIVGTAHRGSARQKVGVRLYSKMEPIDALRTAMHAAGNIEVAFLRALTLNGAPVSVNGVFNNGGTLNGSVECQYYTGVGTVNGTVMQNAPAKDNPASNVVSTYQSMATSIPFQSTMQRFVLSSGVNPWGSVNPNGIYLIQTGGSDVTLKRCRVHGTLVILCGSGRTVRIEDAALFQPASPDYATIVTDGSIDLRLQSTSMELSESTEGTNFNPSGAAYNGQFDADQTDTYPNEIRGLVHAKARVTFSERTRIVGAIVSEQSGQDAVQLNASPIEITYDSTLATSPPIGYRRYQMKVEPNSWKRLAD